MKSLQFPVSFQICRDAKCEFTSFIDLTFHPDFSIVFLNKVFTEFQSKPRTFLSIGSKSRFKGSVIEKIFNSVITYPNTAILH